MKTIEQFNKLALMTMACLFTIACESPPKTAPIQKTPTKPREVKPALAAPAPIPAPSPAEAPRPAALSNADVLALREGIALYNDGDYNGTIRKLNNATEIWTSHNKSLQVSALKYIAFSYCITSRTQLCRQQFERALKIDPGFDLLPSEIGHPIWGPVFLKAKKLK
jgi:tetratricopeptide (TPR) repeat protein